MNEKLQNLENQLININLFHRNLSRKKSKCEKVWTILRNVTGKYYVTEEIYIYTHKIKESTKCQAKQTKQSPLMDSGKKKETCMNKNRTTNY